MNKHTKGTIYALRAGDKHLFKIGFTSGSVTERMKTLQTGCPYPLALFYDIPGTLKTEATIHKMLAEYRTTGEWFEVYSDEVLHTMDRFKYHVTRCSTDPESPRFRQPIHGEWVLINYHGFPLAAVYDGYYEEFVAPHAAEGVSIDGMTYQPLPLWPMVELHQERHPDILARLPEGKGMAAALTWPEEVLERFPEANDDEFVRRFIRAPIVFAGQA